MHYLDQEIEEMHILAAREMAETGKEVNIFQFDSGPITFDKYKIRE